VLTAAPKLPPNLPEKSHGHTGSPGLPSDTKPEKSGSVQLQQTRERTLSRSTCASSFEQDDTMPGQQRRPLAGHAVATDGLESVRIRATTTGVFDNVALAKPKRLQLVRAWAVPTDGQLYGVRPGYPQPTWPANAWHWNRQQPADGPECRPQRAISTGPACCSLSPGAWDEARHRHRRRHLLPRRLSNRRCTTYQEVA